MGLFEFFSRRRAAINDLRAFREPVYETNSLKDVFKINPLGRPVFDLDAHLANQESSRFALPDVPRRQTDPRFVLGWSPKNDSVFVWPLQEAERSKGGIITPEDARQRPQRGIVLAVGPGLWDDEQRQLYPVEASVGDLVTYAKFSGEEFEIEGVKILIVRNLEIKGRRLAGTYDLVCHHLDVDGLEERRVYHEQHTYCAFCAPVATPFVEAERARLREQHQADLAGAAPTMKCPKCGEACTRDTVDVGVGEIPSGPWGCENCGWVQSKPEGLMDDEDETAQTAAEVEDLPGGARGVQIGPPSSDVIEQTRAEILTSKCDARHPVFPAIGCARLKGHEHDHRGFDAQSNEDVYWNEAAETRWEESSDIPY